MRMRLTGALAAGALMAVSLTAPAAASVINGTSGPDVLVGAAKADTIRGGPGTLRRDILRGGDGPDRIYTLGGDVVHGGAGNDTILLGPHFAGAEIYCGAGHDTVVLGFDWVQRSSRDARSPSRVAIPGPAVVLVLRSACFAGADPPS